MIGSANRTFLAALVTAGCLVFQACGPDGSTGPDGETQGKTDTQAGTGTGNGKDTIDAGTNSGAGGTGKVPGIDCEGICDIVVDKPPTGTGTGTGTGGTGDSTKTGTGTPPQTYVPSNTLVVQQCFRGPTPDNDSAPMVKIKHSVTSTPDGDVVTALVVFSRDFTDNTYGANAIGWGRRGHTFEMLSKSDHAELSLLDGAGNTVIQAKIDLISPSASSPTGYASLGVDGGDGLLMQGNRSDIVSASSSMDDNFNRYGYVLLQDSPETDSNYAVNPDYPYWNYYNVYRITVKLSAFGAAGFGKAMMTHVHASPAKLSNDTILVKEGSCPVEGERNPFPGTMTHTGPGSTGGSDTGTGTGTGTDTGTGTGTGGGTGGGGDNT